MTRRAHLGADDDGGEPKHGYIEDRLPEAQVVGEDRRLDLQLIDQYEHDLRLIKQLDLKKDRELILELLNLPSSIKGFGIVKRKNFKTASIHRQNLLEKLKTPKVVANHAAE